MVEFSKHKRFVIHDKPFFMLYLLFQAMKKYKLQTSHKKIIADTITPVSVYLKIRDKYPNSILLESSDYHTNDNSFSYICFNPIASIKADKEKLFIQYPDGTNLRKNIDKNTNIPLEIQQFSERFETSINEDFKFITNGVFGYIAYDAIRYFEDVEITRKEDSIEIPDFYYAVYQHIIIFNHFKNTAYLFEHSISKKSELDAIHQIIKSQNHTTFNFFKSFN